MGNIISKGIFSYFSNRLFKYFFGSFCALLVGLWLYRKFFTPKPNRGRIIGDRFKGKNIIVTGANAGLGLATCKMLAEEGANIILACRSRKSGLEALKEVRKMSSLKDARIELMMCDLSSVESVKSFVREFKEKYDVLDILYNNAAVMLFDRTVTKDGFETMYQTNYLSHVFLMNELRDLLRRSDDPRIINIGIPQNASFQVDLTDIQFKKVHFGMFQGGFNSFFVTKLYMLLYTQEFRKRVVDDNIAVILTDSGKKPFKSNIVRSGVFLGRWFKNLSSVPVEVNAANMVYFCHSEEVITRANRGELFHGRDKKEYEEHWKDEKIIEGLMKKTDQHLKMYYE